jgi:hypothetical protein
VVDDSELRKLERELAATGAPETRVRLARELERLGRRDDAFDVLKPGIADAAVRAEIIRFPAWTHPDGDAGRSACVDVAPIRRQPELRIVRERWDDRAFAHKLLVTPFGLAVCGKFEPEFCIVILDDVSGAVRLRVPRSGTSFFEFADRPCIVEGTLFSDAGSHDLLSVGEIARHPTKGRFLRAMPDRTFLVNEDGRVSLMRQVGIEAPFTIWARDLGGGPDLLGCVASDRVILLHSLDLPLWSAQRLVALDSASGATLWEASFTNVWVVCRLSGQLVATLSDSEQVQVLDAKSGRQLWTTAGAANCYALRADVLVARLRNEDYTSRLEVLNAESGRTRSVLSPSAGHWNRVVAVAVARDVVYFSNDEDREVVAATLDGEILWRTRLPQHLSRSVVVALAPAPRQLYIALADGTVLSLAP